MRSVDAHRAAHDEWNRRDWDALERRIADTFHYIDHARGMSIKTRDEFMDWVKAWAEAFPDGRIVEPTYLEAGDTSVARFRAQGTNDGAFGFLPATGRKVTFDVCEFFTVDSEGRFVSGEAYIDHLGILVQMGHVEAPEQ